LSKGWTSNNTALDEFIRKSQRQTKSPNEAYLEWVPYDRLDISVRDDDGESTAVNGCAARKPDMYIDGGLPIAQSVKLTPLDISDKMNDQYLDQVREKKNDN